MTTLPILILKAACIATIGTGIVSVAASHPAGEGLWSLLFDVLRWPIDSGQGSFSPEARVLNAVCGGVLAGWGSLMYWLVDGPIAQGDRGARRAFATSVLIWFALDSAGSFAAEWPGNVVLNVVFLIALLGPLAALPGGAANRQA